MGCMELLAIPSHLPPALTEEPKPGGPGYTENIQLIVKDVLLGFVRNNILSLCFKDILKYLMIKSLDF